MAVESVNYQCPACGGPLHFSESKGLMVCDYCESSFEVAQIEAHYAAKQSKADASAVAAAERAASGEMSAFEAMGAADGVAVALTEDVLNAAAATSGHASEGDEAIASFLSRASWNEGERDGLRSMTCSSCGAEITCDATTAVSECPYCGNPAVTPGAFVDMARPDGVVPFKLDKDAAVAALNDYYKGKRFLPKKFIAANKVEHIQGVYVPFWLYDGSVEGSGTFECRNERTYRSGDEEVTRTTVYEAYRAGDLDFERVTVDGSAKMPDGHMDAIEPYDFNEMKPFSVAYLPGYVAERYDEDSKVCSNRAEERMRHSFEHDLRATITGYDYVDTGIVRSTTQMTGCMQALLPVWMLHTTWEGNDYLFAMNGQTGRFVGDLPVAKFKVAAWFFGIFVALAAVLFGLDMGVFQFDDTLTSVFVDGVIPAVVAAFVCIVFYNQMKTAEVASDAQAYRSFEGLNLTGESEHFVREYETRRRIEKNDD